MKIRIVFLFVFFSFMQLPAADNLENLLQKACSTSDSSQFYFSKAGLLLKTSKDSANFWFYRSTYACNAGMLDSTVTYGNKALKLLAPLRDTLKMMYVYNNCGKVFQRNGHYELAINTLFNGLKLAEKKRDNLWQGYFFVNIGLNYHDFEDFGKGVKYGKIALANFNISKESTPLNKILALNTIAINFDDWNKPDSALYYHFRVFDFKNEIDTLTIPFTYNNIGNTLLKEKKFREAESWLLRATKIADLNASNMTPLNYAYEKSTHFTNLTIAAYSQNKIQKAYQYIDSTQKYVSKSASIEKLRDLYQLYSMFYKHIEKYKDAMNYQEKYISLRDSIFEKERLMAVQEIETKYHVEKKEKEISEQKAARLSAENQLQIRQTWVIIIGLIAIFLLAVIFLIYRQNKIRARQKEQEFHLREEILRVEAHNQLQEQRLHISRELHDNIGSQLTFILSSVKNMLFKRASIEDHLFRQLKSIENFASETLNELRDTIWITSTDIVRFDSLAERFTGFVEKNAIIAQGLRVEITMDEALRVVRLSSLAGINIYRIIQEAFTNTFKYADATSFVVKINENHDHVVLEIGDNGCGFDVENKHKGNGLKNIEKRSQMLGGNFNIASTINEGTNIRIVFDKKKLEL